MMPVPFGPPILTFSPARQPISLVPGLGGKQAFCSARNAVFDRLGQGHIDDGGGGQRAVGGAG